MHSKPKGMISVITITFNNFEELINTVRSIERVDCIEHVVVNGGSCEKTNFYLDREFQGKYISEPDNGISDAFNKGIHLASGAYVCFLNSGDRLLDETYFTAAENRLGFRYNAACCPLVLRTPGVGDVLKKSRFNLPNMPFNHQGLILKKDHLLSVGGFDDSFKVSMDFDLLVKVLSKYTIIPYEHCRPVILMDGTGVSHTNNFLGILEKERSLKNNGVLSTKLWLLLRWQLFKALIRRVLYSIGLGRLVIQYKKCRIRW